ncbi:MAG: MerR family transcriptional regulator [Sneathiellaceae bacterium]
MTGTLTGNTAGTTQGGRTIQDRGAQDRSAQDRSTQDRSTLAGRRPVGRDPDGARRGEKSPQAFRTISEVAQDLEVPPHVLRFWETKFSQVRPLKRGGGRRYYRPEDVDLLRRIRALLYREGYTIKGVQRVLREGGSQAADAAGGRGGTAVETAPPAAGGAAESAASHPHPRTAGADTVAGIPDEADHALPGQAAAGPGPGLSQRAAPDGGADPPPPAVAGVPAGDSPGGVPADVRGTGSGGQAALSAAAASARTEASASVDQGAASAAHEQDWRQRLGKVLIDLRTVREVLQRELDDPAS